MGEYNGKVFDKVVRLTEHGFKISLCCLLSHISNIHTAVEASGSMMSCEP